MISNVNLSDLDKDEEIIYISNILLIFSFIFLFLLFFDNHYLALFYELKHHPYRKNEYIKKHYFHLLRTVPIYQKSRYFTFKVFYLVFFFYFILDVIEICTEEDDIIYDKENNIKNKI